MATLKIQFGDLYVAPTPGEQGWASVGGAALLLGLLTGSKTLSLVGAATVAGVGLAVYEEAKTFTDPDVMNGYFQTGGEYSAASGGEADAQALRWRRR